ncbi:MAG: methyltransferase domain-containing protein [Myxococcota bacterium]
MTTGFANPWEHVRLLSDAPRNDAMIALLARRAPGARVLEVGCGTGLLSCVAARLGATRVFAVEPTPLAEVARALVAENGLAGVVEVVRARVEDVPPLPVDLAFSELLNADPFVEGVLPAMDAAAAWGGRLAPRRLRVWAALARAGGSAREYRAARAEVRRLGDRHGLRVGALEGALATREAYVTVTATESPVGPPVLVWDLALGAGERPSDRAVTLSASEPGPVAGVLVWFEAELDDELVLANPPGAGGHWGQLLASFAEERGVRAGEGVHVEIGVRDGGVTVRA